MKISTRTATYDDTKLEKLFAELQPKQRIKAMKGALRSASNVVRKAAISELRSSIRSDRDLERGVRAIVFKKTFGFRVTVGTKVKRSKDRMGWTGVAGFHKTRQYLRNPSKYSPKPVLIWAEDGTAPRRQKRGYESRKSVKDGRWRKRRAYNGRPTGRMRAYRFMVKAKEQTASSVTENIRREFRYQVEKTAKKYRCIV